MSIKKKSDKEVKRPKEPSQSIVKRILPANERTWILQPTSITIMRYDYDTTQTKILVTVIQRLYEVIRAVINGKSPTEQLSLFNDHNFGPDEVGPDEVMIGMQLRDFGVDHRRYEDIRQALKRLSEQTVWIPVKDKVGRSYEKAEQIFIPYIPNDKYNKNIYIKMKKVNVERFTSVDFGYHRYLKEVVFETRNKYVQRIYMYLRIWAAQSITPEIKTSELRFILKLEDKYPRWSMFYSKVLEPVQKELREKAESGMADCYFELECIYKEGASQRGEPDKLKFHIMFSDRAAELGDCITDDPEMVRLQEILRNDFGVRGPLGKLQQFMGEHVPLILDKIPEWKSYIDAHKDELKNPAGYVLQCIAAYIDELNEKSAPVAPEPDPAPQKERRVDDFSRDHIERMERDTNLNDIQSAAFLNLVQSLATPTDWNSWLSPIRVLSIMRDPQTHTTEQVIIGFPNKVVQEKVFECYSAIIQKAVKEIWGDVKVLCDTYKI